MNKFAIELKWAIIFAIAALAWLGLERLVGLHDAYIAQHASYTNLFAIVAIAVYYFALEDKRKNYYGGRMSWKQGFLSGLIISVIVAILSPLTMWIGSTLVAPDYFANAIDYAVRSKVSTREEAEQFFSYQNYALINAVSAILIGALTAAIVAIFTRGPKPFFSRSS